MAQLLSAGAQAQIQVPPWGQGAQGLRYSPDALPRLKASGILEAAEPERLYRNLNPIWLKRQMKAAQEELWKHTKCPRHEPTKAEVLVTRIYEATNASR